MDLMQQIFELCVVPLLGLLTGFVVNYINTKSKEIKQNKYTELLKETVIKCVKATNQTYVESLKNKNAFDEEAQKEAFDRTKRAVFAVLTSDAKQYLEATYEDLDGFIDILIEASIKE